MTSTANVPKARACYTVGFICALNLEMSAVRYLLDCEHPSLPSQPGDSNLYILGELSGYNIVLAWLPGNQGKGAAATVATNLSRSFPAIKWRFLVGIGGGIPSDRHDIRLGDVVIGMPEGQHGGVVQYDLGQDEEEVFKLKGFLLPPPAELRNAVVLMQSNHLIAENKIEAFINQMIGKSPRLSIYRRPPSEEDILFAIDYVHDVNQFTCQSCDRQKAVYRQPRDAERPEIHYGLIASGDRVMRSAAKRQATAHSVGDILCFEMEAAGITTEYPCIAIRGISDYSDSHKNDKWQYYAAATAAATAKELLSCIPGGTNQQTRAENSGKEISDTGPDPVTLQQSQDCAKSLAFEEMNNRINDTSIAAAEGTCKWLLQHKVYADWSSQNRALLWIKGKPGSGKSTLLRYFLDKIGNAFETKNREIILSFFFHGRGVDLEKTPLGLFRSLLYQLMTQMPEVEPHLIQTLQRRCDTMGKPGKDWHWHLRELQDAFRVAISNTLQHRAVWLFVDALDECGKRNAIHLVNHFGELLSSISPTSCRFLICLTSRNYPILNLGSTYEIKLEDENGEDISTLVQDRLSLMDEKIASRMADIITTQANGIFMWASLVVERVIELELDGVNLAEIEEKVRSTPRELYDIYLGLIQNMKDRRKSRKLIQWICFATRPLSLDELRWVLAIDADHASPVKSLQHAQASDGYIVDNARMERQLKSLSCGLVEIVSTSNQRVAQFIHQSVWDFFVEKGIPALDDSVGLSENGPNRVAGMAHYEISRTCIRYMTMEEIVQSPARREGLRSQFPLLCYAATSWINHAKASERRQIAQEDLLIYFAWPSTRLVQAWLRIFGRIDHFSEDFPHAMTDMLHILSRHDLVSPLRRILRANEVHVNVNVRDFDGRTPLLWAALRGNATVVELLLNTDQIDVNARDAAKRTPLLWAAANGHRNVVELLLATKNVDADAKSVSGRTPLSWAAEKGHIAIVELLAVANANPNLPDAEGKSALYYALREEQLHVVGMLFRAGADISWAGTSSGTGEIFAGWLTLLMLAIRTEEVELVKLLLGAGANLQAENESGAVPRQFLHTSTNAAIRSLVLDMVVHTSAPDTLKWTILKSFGSEGYLSTLKVLLSIGSDTDIPDMEGLTVLMSASCRDHIEAVQVLLKGGAKVDVSNEDGDTALHIACDLGHVEVLKVLLENGANIEASNKFGATPLHSACSNGHIAAMRVLLENGANIEASDELKYTPLHAVCCNGNAEAADLLLQSGANIEARNSSGATPLFIVSLLGHTRAIKTLLESGAEIGAIDEDGDTVLSLASAPGQTGAVNLLLENGADEASLRTRLQCGHSRPEHSWVQTTIHGYVCRSCRGG